MYVVLHCISLLVTYNSTLSRARAVVTSLRCVLQAKHAHVSRRLVHGYRDASHVSRIAVRLQVHDAQISHCTTFLWYMVPFIYVIYVTVTVTLCMDDDIICAKILISLIAKAPKGGQW
jgi:hypothetical protein